jgi:transcriptional regulator with XRE-family HTH domain
MGKKLPNYLRVYRQKTGLSQQDMAYLVGSRIGGVKVCRYERRQREPNLKNAIAFEIVLGTAMRELFAGTFDEVRKRIERRADVLVHKLRRSGPGCLIIENTPLLRESHDKQFGSKKMPL